MKTYFSSQKHQQNHLILLWLLHMNPTKTWKLFAIVSLLIAYDLKMIFFANNL